MGYGKTFVHKKKTKHICLVRFLNDEGYPETLYCTKLFKYFRDHKKCTLGAHFGSILNPPEPKTMYVTCFFYDFTRFAFEPQKWRKQLSGQSRWSKLGQESPVLVPDSTDHTHPVAHTLKRFVHAKPPR